MEKTVRAVLGTRDKPFLLRKRCMLLSTVNLEIEDLS